MSHITLNVVEPGSTPVDPVVPNTGLFTHGIGGPEATTIIVGILAIVAVVATILYHKKKHSKVDKADKTNKLVQSINAIKAKKKVSIPLAALALIVSLSTLTALLVNAGKSNTSAAEGNTENSLTVTESSADLTIEVADTPVFAVLPVELTIEEATEAGYTLTAYTDNTDLVSTTDGSKVIPMVAADEGELVALADNTYGLALDNKPASKDNEVYTVLSTNQDTPTVIKSIDDYSETPAEDKTTIYYGFYITPDTPKGTYEGSEIAYEAEANEVPATVVYDGNGLYFNNDEGQTTNTAKYTVSTSDNTEKYSHTPNVSDNGTKESDVKYSTFVNNVVTIPGASSIKINLTYGGGYKYGYQMGYLSFWQGVHPDYRANINYESGIQKCGESTVTDGKYYTENDSETVECEIPGDSVTFDFWSQGGGPGGVSWYGYYAIVTGYDADGNIIYLPENNLASGDYLIPGSDSYYRFLGWSTTQEATTPEYVTEKDIETSLALTPGETTTLYAKWEPAFAISYNGNGAGSTTNMDYAEQYTTDLTSTNKQVDLLASNFTKSGYGFVGWSTDQDAWTHLTDDDESNNPTIYGPNQMITVDPSTSTKLNLYAVWVPAETDASGNPISLQDWQGCSSLTATTYSAETGTLTVGRNTITALTDTRDGNIYTVARLADGNCWMTDNLRLDNNPELSQQNTNNPSLPLTNNYAEQTTSNFLSATSNDWCTSADAPCYNQSKLNTKNTALTTASPVFSQDFTSQYHKDFNDNISSYSNNYNWYSATAGNGTYSKESGEVAGDICPAGWMLPIGNQTTANGSFSHLDVSMGGTGSYQYATEASNKWRSFPNNFVYSGNWGGSSAYGRGNSGYYWSSTAYGTNYAYRLYLYSGYVGPGTDTYDKYNGLSVRCVAPVGTTITFDGNGNTGGEMSKQRIAPNTTAPLDSNKFTKGDDVFASWNTQRDGSGTSYTDGQDYTTGEGSNNITLYAQWVDCVPNKICYKSNGANSPTIMPGQSASSNTNVELWASNYKYDVDGDSHNDYGFAGWSEDKDAATKLTDNNPDNNPVVYGPNQTITTGDLSTEGMKLYAVWIAPEQNTSFQDFTCPTNTDMPIGTVIALKDNRDNEVYTVAKLVDGNCWMTENLRLDNNATINATNTNNPISSFTALSPSSNSWCTQYTDACLNQSLLNANNITNTVSPMTETDANTYSYSNYYNWYSATAGNGTYSKESGTVSGDICPAGWHLPYGGRGTGEKGGNTSGGFYYLNQQMGAATGAAGSNNWRSFPNNFVYSGRWSSSSADSRGSGGNYWSSTASNISGAYHVNFDSNYVSPGMGSGGKFIGFSVRCVAPVQ